MHDAHPHHDAAISKWFEIQGWNVTLKHYDFDRDVLAWRAEKGTPMITLRVSRCVLEDVPENVLIDAFETRRLAEALRKQPDKYTLVHEFGGQTVVVQLPAAP